MAIGVDRLTLVRIESSKYGTEYESMATTKKLQIQHDTNESPFFPRKMRNMDYMGVNREQCGYSYLFSNGSGCGNSQSQTTGQDRYMNSEWENNYRFKAPVGTGTIKTGLR